MPATSFAAASRGSQVYRLRLLAASALEHYPIDVRRLRLLYHGHNTTFRIDAEDGKRYALRVNVNSRSSEQNLIAETAWLAAISDDTDINVPRPQPTRSGQRRTTVWSEDLGRDLPVVVMSWLPGRHHDPPSPAELGALGRVQAVLHDHAERWSMPADGAFPSHADVFAGDERRLFDPDNGLSGDQREIVEHACARSQSALNELWSSDQARPIHADLHLGNVLWKRGSISVLDFDDALIGLPVQDLAISTYYLRARTDAVLDPFFDGYAAERSLPLFTEDQFESLVAGRNLLGLNELIGVVNADWQQMFDGYLANTIVKLRAYLETGRYCHNVEGVVEINR